MYACFLTKKERKEKMNIQKSKTLTTIALVLLLTLAMLSAAIYSVGAIDITSYSYMAVSPNPTGVGQPSIVSFWILPAAPTATDVFHNLKVTITKPDGTTENKGPFTTSTVGSQYFIYTPSMVGNYTFKLTYPGETFTRGGYYYTPSESNIFNLVVQPDFAQPYPEAALPTDYWTRPIYGQNRAWSRIAGDWLQSGYNATGKAFDAQFGFNPYTTAPKSAHVMYTKPLAFGGIVGGDYGDISYYAGLSYESKAQPSLIMNGRLYYNIKPTSSVNQGFTCIDLRTGETLWTNKNWSYAITLGQEFEYVSGNQGGLAGAYLWQTGSTYRMFDAFTGDLFLTFNNAMTGTNVFDKHGNWYVYVYNGAGRWLAMWNFTKAIVGNNLITFNPSGEGMYRPQPRGGNPENPYNWMAGIEWNTTDLPDRSMTIPTIAPDGTITANTTLRPSIFGVSSALVAQVGTSQIIYREIGYSLENGAELWWADRNTTTPSVWGTHGDGKYIRFFLDRRVNIAYDAKTGQELWTSDPMDAPWGTFSSQYGTVAYNKFYYGGYDGHEYAYDLNTGKQIWKASSGNAGTETPYGSYPMWYGPVIGGGVVFVGSGEHSPTHPLIRGEHLFALDAETGAQIWNITGLMVTRSIADGYLVTYNAYDNNLYVFGKGPSKTTVTAPQTVVPQGTGVMITGTVTDQSSGQKDTPAIADKDMSRWMEYLKMQMPLTSDVEGVPVELTATAPDGTVTTIGTVTSEMSGKFGFMWTPPTEGTYKIRATFKGSESYGSSYDETFVGVGPAQAAPTSTPVASPTVSPQPTQTPVSPQAPFFTTEVMLAIAAVIIIVVIVAAVALFRRRK